MYRNYMIKIKMICDSCEKVLGNIEVDDAYAGGIIRAVINHNDCNITKDMKSIDKIGETTS